MTALNAYATLEDFKAWKQIQSYNPQLDAVVDSILESVSRVIDDRTQRSFYPRVETRYHSTPGRRELRLDDDLAEVITITNGDGTTLASTHYYTLPRNQTPYYALVIKLGSTEVWEYNTDNGDEYTIGINGVWVYHNRYSTSAWASVGTLGAAMSNTTSLTLTMSTGHTVKVGQILRIDNELLQVTAKDNNTITLYKRGDNGSTAATHLISTTVNAFQPMADIKNLCLEVSHNVFGKRYGESNQSAAIVTGAGVVITPKDLSKINEDVLKTYRRMY